MTNNSHERSCIVVMCQQMTPSATFSSLSWSTPLWVSISLCEVISTLTLSRLISEIPWCRRDISIHIPSIICIFPSKLSLSAVWCDVFECVGGHAHLCTRGSQCSTHQFLFISTWVLREGLWSTNLELVDWLDRPGGKWVPRILLSPCPCAGSTGMHCLHTQLLHGC